MLKIIESRIPKNLSVSERLAKEVALIVGASFLLGLFGKVAIPLPFSLVPLTLQSHIALLIGAVLGSKRGSLAVLAFLIEGMMGWPVFSMGGSGLLHILGPKGGYLVGYLIGAYATGYFIEKGKSGILAVFAGSFLIYVPGVLWLSTFIGMKMALLTGCLPFIVGDAIKSVFISKAYLALRRRA